MTTNTPPNKQPEAWEKLASMVIRMMEGTYNSNDARKADVKNAIKSYITSQRASDVRRLEGMKKNGMNGEGLPFENSPEIYGNARMEAWKNGHNQALDQAIDIIKDNN